MHNIEIVRFDSFGGGDTPPPGTNPPTIPAALVRTALTDARSLHPDIVHRTVALSIQRASTKTAQLRLERLARVVMSADPRVTDPRAVWASNWAGLSLAGVELLDRAITTTWKAPSTRNAMRDSIRAVLRESLNAGLFTHDQATPLLNAVRPEKTSRDPEKQARGHIPHHTVEDVFKELANDHTITARRDALAIALMVGAGLRRAEVCAVRFTDLDERRERLTVRGKGDTVRDVPLAPGTRRALDAWIEVRGTEPGSLVTPLSHSTPRTPLIGRTLSTNTVAQLVTNRFGPTIRPHDLRRTFTGNLLDSGADLSIAAQVLGHSSPATTAGYDRRGFTARRAAVERLYVPFQDAHE